VVIRKKSYEERILASVLDQYFGSMNKFARFLPGTGPTNWFLLRSSSSRFLKFI